MDALLEIGGAHGVDIIEDAAEAHGAEYRGRKVGGLGKCGVFSFYGNKVITTGEGGMLTTNDRAFYLRAKRLRDHAMSPAAAIFSRRARLQLSYHQSSGGARRCAAGTHR